MRKNDTKFESIKEYKLIHEIKVDENIINSVYERLKWETIFIKF